MNEINLLKKYYFLENIKVLLKIFLLLRLAFFYTFFLISFLSCQKTNLEVKLSQVLFENEPPARLEILFEKEVPFTFSNNSQKVFILRNVNEEILALIFKEHEELKLFKKFIFTNPLYGQYQYDFEKKVWFPKEYIHNKELCLIRKIDFIQLPEDPFFSIFLEVLTEEPPLPLVSVPFVIREREIIFNGLEELTPLPFLKETRYSSFEYKNGELKILTNLDKLVLTYIYKNKRFLLVRK